MVSHLQDTVPPHTPIVSLRSESGQSREQEGRYLLGGRVFDSVRVVIIINDIQVLHRITRKSAAELHVERGFPSPLGVDSEVGRLPILHT